MTTMFDEKNLEKTREELEELRKGAEAEKRRCESIGCKLMASLSSKRAAKRETDLANAENAIKQTAQNLRELERWKRQVVNIERMGSLSGGVITKLKKGTETRRMMEERSKQLAAEREQSRARKFGNTLSRRRR